MKRTGSRIIFVLCLSICCLLMVIYFEISKKVYTASKKALLPVSIITPATKITIPGVKNGNSVSEYTSKFGYRLKYPSSWTPATFGQLPSFNGTASVFTVGPIGNTVLGFPSFIQIAVDSNSASYSLHSFEITQYPGAHSVKQIIARNTWDILTGVSGSAQNSIYLLEAKGQIFQVRFFDGVAPKITSAQLAGVLESFTVQ